MATIKVQCIKIDNPSFAEKKIGSSLAFFYIVLNGVTEIPPNDTRNFVAIHCPHSAIISYKDVLDSNGNPQIINTYKKNSSGAYIKNSFYLKELEIDALPNCYVVDFKKNGGKNEIDNIIYSQAIGSLFPTSSGGINTIDLAKISFTTNYQKINCSSSYPPHRI
ncbi:MAG: hypothetical protein MUF43_06870 [Flavobacterium sp.]|jgi:hypothetical protein|nr:hypothetical protein [Flavobacterium sp.]